MIGPAMCVNWKTRSSALCAPKCENSTIRVADLPPILRKYATADGGEDVVETPKGAPEAGAGMTVGGGGAQPQPSFSQPVGALRDYLREQELGYVNRAPAQTGGDKEKGR